MTSFLTILAIFCWCFISISSSDELTVTDNPRVEIPDLGAVFGETYHYVRDEYPTIDTHIDIFRGIPFAKPPVGELRFAKPVAAEPFEEDYNATYYRSACNQLGSEGSNPGEEDCLHLNIWTPNPRVCFILSKHKYQSRLLDNIERPRIYQLNSNLYQGHCYVKTRISSKFMKLRLE